MTSSPIQLSEKLNSWADAGIVGISETARAVVVSRLSAEQIFEVRQLTLDAGLEVEFKDEANEILDDELDDDFGPFIATIRKEAGLNHHQAITVSGLRDFISEVGQHGLCEVAFLNSTFESEATRFVSWGSLVEPRKPAPLRKNPRDIVREGAEVRLTPSDLRPWLLSEGEASTLWVERAFSEWAALSAAALTRSIASEVIGPQLVVFHGPPRSRQPLTPANLAADLGADGFSALQHLASWVFEEPTTTEQRHALLASEIARVLPTGLLFAGALKEAGLDALDGARLAFQLSQTEISRDALRAQADLRKAVGDDTGKVADSTRTLAGALTLAMATGLGLIVTRATSSTQAEVMGWAAGIAAIYLFAVAGSGWLYLQNQADLRKQWRRRFYRFLPKDDYDAMVTKPVRNAELPYHIIGFVAVIVALGLFGLSVNLIN